MKRTLDLTTFERRVLDELCQRRTTRSIVVLASDLYDKGAIERNGDPVSLLTIVVDHLNELGLVTYHLGLSHAPVPTEIRVTKEGAKVAGYPQQTIIGHHSLVPLHLGPTDFRSLQNATTGGPIERMPLAEHLDKYPSHRAIHPEPWELNIMSNKRPSAASIGRIPNAIRAAGHPLTYRELQAALGVDMGTVSVNVTAALEDGIIVKAGKTEGANGHRPQALLDLSPASSNGTNGDKSTRDAILSLLRERDEAGLPPVVDTLTLVGMLRKRSDRFGNADGHSVAHVLQSLRQQGEVTFHNNKSGNMQRLEDIEIAASKRRREAVEVSRETIIDAIATIDDEAHALVDAPIPTAPSPSYPYLDQLRSRQAAQSKSNETAGRYFEAAALLEAIDPEESARLFAMSERIAVKAHFTPLEAEYLAFAADSDWKSR